MTIIRSGHSKLYFTYRILYGSLMSVVCNNAIGSFPQNETFTSDFFKQLDEVGILYFGIVR